MRNRIKTAKVLITVSGGVATVYAIKGNAVIEIIDFDNCPNAEIPKWAKDHRFNS